MTFFWFHLSLTVFKEVFCVPLTINLEKKGTKKIKKN